MSFSSILKHELCSLYQNDKHCDLSELAGIINTCGNIYLNNNKYILEVHTENAIVAKRFYSLVKKSLEINCEITTKNTNQFKKSRIYTVLTKDDASSEKLLHATGLLNFENGNYIFKKQINKLLVASNCCKRSYIRGAFIAGGSLSNPEKTYHLEFVNSDFELSTQLSELINFFDLNSKIIERKNNYVIYLKESENIVDILNIMGAYNSLMNLENVRIIKDMRNNVNRIVNCETANINKTVDAAINQIDDINFIKNCRGLEFLSKNLEQVASLRLENPEATLKEIGTMLTPKVGKSGVNHRLRKISEIAENLRGGI